MLNTMMENESTSFAKISERNRNISKTCVFIFHHSIQNEEASGYIFYKDKFSITVRIEKLTLEIVGKIAKIKIHSKDKTLYLQLLAKQFGLKYCLSFAELF